MRPSIRPSSCRRRAVRLVASLALVVLGTLRLLPGPDVAAAVVTRVAGYRAAVDGYGSWYGSYGMGDLGIAWCIDHGIRAPDPALRYVPAAVTDRGAAVPVALAWMFGRHGMGADRVTAAALMLAGHDLMGAVYPSGPLSVDALTPARMSGFGTEETAVLERARFLRADSLAHAHLVPPYSLALEATFSPDGTVGVFVAALRDAHGMPVEGVEVHAGAVGTAVAEPRMVRTGPDGTAVFGFAAAPAFRLEAIADAPDLMLQAFAPTAARAQRVARPARVAVGAVLDVTMPTTTTTTAPPTTTTTTTAPPTTTTTSTTSTTTTVPPTTTSTTTPATTSTTVAPATTAPPTTATTSTSTSTTVAPTTTTAAPVPRQLPRTGVDPVGIGATGLGLVLLGTSVRPPRRHVRV